MLTIKRSPLASAAWLVQDFCCAGEMAARHAACLVHELYCVRKSPLASASWFVQDFCCARKSPLVSVSWLVH